MNQETTHLYPESINAEKPMDFSEPDNEQHVSYGVIPPCELLGTEDFACNDVF